MGLFKKIVKRMINPFWDKYSDLFKTSHHRNDEEIELKIRMDNPLYLERFGFKVYAQADDDGIIEEIFNRIQTTNKTFVEFGVNNGLECNTHYLVHQGWNGLWIDGSKKYIKGANQLFFKVINTKQLNIINGFITKDNINTLIAEEGKLSGEIDLLSIDIDGNDYWVWKAITCVKPRVVVIEYNAKFPPNFEWVMAYNPTHIWRGDDNQGASLKALEKLGHQLGYQLVGTNTMGINAFFVREDLTKNFFVKPATAENLYNPFRWKKRYISGHPSRQYIGKAY